MSWFVTKVTGRLLEYVERPRALSWHLSTFAMGLVTTTTALSSALGFVAYRFDMKEALLVWTGGLLLIFFIGTVMAELMTRRLMIPINALRTKSLCLQQEILCDVSNTRVIEFNETIAIMRNASSTILARAKTQEMLLRELNHRVKNSLQNVLSVLRLQLSRVPAVCRPALQEASLRVAAIGRVHEGLYDAAEPTVSSLYLTKLLDDVCQIMPVDLDCTILDIALDLDLAVPLSLFLHEAVSNAIKFGATDPHDVRHTPVRVVFQHGVDKTQWSLEIRDYGPGFAPGVNTQNVKTLGFKLMKNLAVQLNGDLKMFNHPDGGAIVSIAGPVTLPRINK